MADVFAYQHPSAVVPYTADFTDDLPSTDSALADIGTSTITAKNFAGTDVSSTVLANKARSGTTLTFDVQSLTEGEEYKVTCLGVGATSNKKFIKVFHILARQDIQGSF